MTRTPWSFVVPLALTASVGCTPESPDPVTLGALLSVTGGLAATGAEQLDAVSLAIEHVNAAGGVLGGRPLTIVHRDDGTDAAQGRTAAEQLVGLGVPLVFGAPGSAITLATAEIFAPAEVVQISASSTSPLLTSADDNGGYLNRTCPSDALQGKLVSVRAAETHGFTRMAIIHIPGAYGEGLANAFEADFTGRGHAVTHKIAYTEGEASYRPVLDTIYATDPAPEAILLVGYPVDGAQILNDYLQHYAASKPTFWFFTDALETDAFIAGVGASRFTFAHEGTGPGTPVSDEFAAFKTAFVDRHGRDPLVGEFSPNAYDAVLLAALAIEAAGSAEGPAIRAKLAEVSAGGTQYSASQFAAAAAAARNGEDIDYVGASGPADMNAEGDVVAPYDIWDVNNGEIRILHPSVLP